MTHYNPDDYENDEHKEKRGFWNVRTKVVLLALLFWVLIVVIAIDTEAQERVRLYDTDKGIQKYTGYAEKQSNDEWRFYDKHGLYEGRMTKDRLFNEKGDVTQKYYLLNK